MQSVAERPGVGFALATLDLVVRRIPQTAHFRASEGLPTMHSEFSPSQATMARAPVPAVSGGGRHWELP